MWRFKDEDIDDVVNYYIKQIEDNIESGNIVDLSKGLTVIIHRLCPIHIENLERMNQTREMSNKGKNDFYNGSNMYRNELFDETDDEVDELNLSDSNDLNDDESTTNLQYLLNKHSLQISKSQPNTPKDGNCAIHSLVDQLRYVCHCLDHIILLIERTKTILTIFSYANNEHGDYHLMDHNQLRLEVVGHLDKSRLDEETIQQFKASHMASENQSWSQEMSMDQVYVDEPFLLLVADLFRRDIVILPSRRKYPSYKGTKYSGLWVIRTRETKESKLTPFYLLYDEQIKHYQSLRPLDEENPLVVPEDEDLKQQIEEKSEISTRSLNILPPLNSHGELDNNGRPKPAKKKHVNNLDIEDSDNEEAMIEILEKQGLYQEFGKIDLDDKTFFGICLPASIILGVMIRFKEALERKKKYIDDGKLIRDHGRRTKKEKKKQNGENLPISEDFMIDFLTTKDNVVLFEPAQHLRDRDWISLGNTVWRLAMKSCSTAERRKAYNAIHEEHKKICDKYHILEKNNHHSLKDVLPIMEDYYNVNIVVHAKNPAKKRDQISWLQPKDIYNHLDRPTVHIFQQKESSSTAHVSTIYWILKFFRSNNSFTCHFCKIELKSHSGYHR